MVRALEFSAELLRLSKLAQEKGMSLVTPKLGEIVTLNDRYINNPWWVEFIDQE